MLGHLVTFLLNLQTYEIAHPILYIFKNICKFSKITWLDKGTSGHPHLQLWPVAWLRVASLLYRKPLPSRRMRIWQNLCRLFSCHQDAARQTHRSGEQKALVAPPEQTLPMRQSYGRTTLPRATCFKCEGQEHRCLCLCPLLPATHSH